MNNYPIPNSRAPLFVKFQKVRLDNRAGCYVIREVDEELDVALVSPLLAIGHIYAVELNHVQSWT